MTDIEQACRIVAEKLLGWNTDHHGDWELHGRGQHLDWLRTGNGMVEGKAELVRQGWFVRTVQGPLANCEIYRQDRSKHYESIAETEEEFDAFLLAAAKLLEGEE